MSAIIEVKNVGKKYTIGERQSYLALRDIVANIIKAPITLLKGKKKNKEQNDFWALQDINFTVEPGEVVGIIGKNGAGKSTLLKILSQITPPTTGEIKLKGRVGSLLEVGTGFHPELTGRENIFLNGAILGMRKKEIEKKFDEIVAFSGVEKFIDTPVKRYSSGMYVRLAFAVAAHLEPEILVIDEVLAVGDAEFQKKCLGKMQEVTEKEGRTVLFVSHNMGVVRNLCNRTVLLEGGKVKMIGPTAEVVNAYMSLGAEQSKVTIEKHHHLRGDQSASITSIQAHGSENNSDMFSIDEPISFEVKYEVKEELQAISFWIIFYDESGKAILSSFQKDTGVIEHPEKGEHTLHVSYDTTGLLPGTYSISMGIFRHEGTGNTTDFSDWVEQCMSITVGEAFFDGRNFDQRLGVVHKLADWKEI